jgi:hypothetical protein
MCNPSKDDVVDELAVAEPVPEAGLRKQVGRVRHRLHAARDDDLVPASANHEVGDLDRPDRGGADLVDRVRRHFLRDAGRDRGLSSRRLAHSGLKDLPDDRILDLVRLELRALERAADRDRAELRRREMREPAAEAPERRADGRHDDGRGHTASVPATGSRPLLRGIS